METLCVDPDEAARERTRAALSAAGFEVEACGTVAEVADCLVDGRPECVVTEHGFPDGTGFDVVGRVRERAPDAACVLYTATPPDEVDTAAEQVVLEYLPKSEDREELVGLVERLAVARPQTAYPLPADEDDRLAAVGRASEVAGELGASFDRLTELATALFGVEAAGVGLVDVHHEEFVACHGVDLGTIDREDTVCTYTILEDSVTVVEDTTDDPRFADVEVIHEAGIRFYAGAPIVVDGRTVGSFCLFDDTRRSFGGRDRGLLELFAAEVADRVETAQRLGDRPLGDPVGDGEKRATGDSGSER
jgi:CheY-like chemotaxis protein